VGAVLPKELSHLFAVVRITSLLIEERKLIPALMKHDVVAQAERNYIPVSSL
jgi:hypothetical protein